MTKFRTMNGVDVCGPHGRIRCGECRELDGTREDLKALQEENAKLRAELDAARAQDCCDCHGCCDDELGCSHSYCLDHQRQMRIDRDAFADRLGLERERAEAAESQLANYTRAGMKSAESAEIIPEQVYRERAEAAEARVEEAPDGPPLEVSC